MAGVIAAVEYLADLGRHHAPEVRSRRTALATAYDVIGQHEAELSAQLIGGLLDITALTFYGIKDPAKFNQRTPTVAVRMEGYTPRELAEYLGKRGIFTWDGNYYAVDLAERLGVQQSGGMLRIGLAHYNTAEEVDRLLSELRGLAAR
jgi:selenocysteine lyase/cysteine desulfurase